jgi:iron complex outermembrane receptor protein
MNMGRSILMCCAAIAWFASPAVFAQTQDQAGALEEVVVTAQRRSENLQSVPIAITALTAQNLASQGITDTQKLELVTPGLVFSTFNGAGQPYIRGIGADQLSVAGESAVAFYIDGVYRPTIYALNQDFFDIERVEILEGPQGTLYGRNATGGAINIITRDPTANFDGAALLWYGAHETVHGGIFVNGGTERLAGSFSAYYSGHEGFQRNLFDGTRINDKQTLSLRGKAKLALDAAGDWTAVISADLTRDHGRSDTAFTYLYPNALPAALGGTVTTNPSEVAIDFPGAHRDIDDRGVSATIRGPVGALSFVSISAYRQTQMVSGVDYDNSDIFIANVAADQRAHSYSQEFQLLSPSDGRLQWVLGAYGFFGYAAFDPLQVLTPSPDPLSSDTSIYGAQQTRALAAFAQGTLDITDALSFTAGIRYNSEHKKLTEQRIVFPNAGVEVPFPLGERTWNQGTPKASLQYTNNGQLLYVSASEGFKSGNFNVGSPGSSPVEPEKMNAIEVGGKHNIFGNKGRLNWSAFRYDYKDLQVNIVENGVERLENAARERSYGADLDVEFSVARGLVARVGAAYLHATYEEYQNASVFLPNTATGFGNVPTTIDASGRRALRSPEWTVSTNLTYAHDFGLGEWTNSVTYYYNSGFFFDAGNRIEQGAYSIVNLRSSLRFVHARAPVTIAVFANNLTDKRTVMGVVSAIFGDYGGYSDPRTIGVEARVDF